MSDTETPFPGTTAPRINPEAALPNGSSPRDIPVFDCNTCGDTGEVRILFQSATGLMPGKKAVACPDCKAGNIQIASRSDERIATLENSLRLLKIALIVAAAIATFALVYQLLPERETPIVKADLKSAGGVKSE